MKAFPAQFSRFSKNVMGDNLITLRVDALYSKDISELVAKDIGTEFMVVLEEVDINMPAPVETTDLKEKFWKKMHSLINDYAVLWEKSPEHVKSHLKEVLIKEGLIEKSTKELDIKGLTRACALLEKWIAKYGK